MLYLVLVYRSCWSIIHIKQDKHTHSPTHPHTHPTHTPPPPPPPPPHTHTHTHQHTNQTSKRSKTGGKWRNLFLANICFSLFSISLSLKSISLFFKYRVASGLHQPPYRPFSHCIDQAGLSAFTAKSGRKHYNPPPLTVMWMNYDSPNFPSICSLSAIISFQTCGNKCILYVLSFHKCIKIKYKMVNMYGVFRD